tara:strand:+ start:460 stop:801 length:342 start_codon:yes stop_codon:yes gene_type:complete
MSFEENIKEWVKIDNQIKTISTSLKELRETKSEILDKLVDHATENNLDHKTIEISDGFLKFQNRKESKPLTFKFIKQCFTECISDENQINKLIDYMKERREFKYVNELKRNYK